MRYMKNHTRRHSKHTLWGLVQLKPIHAGSLVLIISYRRGRDRVLSGSLGFLQSLLLLGGPGGNGPAMPVNWRGATAGSNWRRALASILVAVCSGSAKEGGSIAKRVPGDGAPYTPRNIASSEMAAAAEILVTNMLL
ncbi:hypothetical protein NA57DRAFT_58129 [Rhizodiscina lignyota]|uniref:Uncharacterized protein n=1 Tax=Rhizodiscina lignyota TaxID=1504668 RepID=A0A9P4IDY5_9PEZI|nr:hypothetical protein NA57DRAFT_58129 [Rhizodiscina lignyota]